MPSGRKFSEASGTCLGAAAMAEADARRNAFYPPASRINGETDNSGGIHNGTYSTTLEAYLKSISNRNPSNSGSACAPSPPQLYYTPPRSAHQRPGLPTQPPPPAPHPRSHQSAILNQQNGSSPSPRPPRSVSAGYNGSSARRLQRAHACRLPSNPYEATPVARGDTNSPIFAFSPSKLVAIPVPSPGESSNGDGGEARQEYHHQYFWYSHQPPRAS